jgi:hypothetical protein
MEQAYICSDSDATFLVRLMLHSFSFTDSNNDVTKPELPFLNPPMPLLNSRQARAFPPHLYQNHQYSDVHAPQPLPQLTNYPTAKMSPAAASKFTELSDTFAQASAQLKRLANNNDNSAVVQGDAIMKALNDVNSRLGNIEKSVADLRQKFTHFGDQAANKQRQKEFREKAANEQR